MEGNKKGGDEKRDRRQVAEDVRKMQKEERKQRWEDRVGEMGVEEVGEWGTEPRAATSQQGR